LPPLTSSRSISGRWRHWSARWGWEDRLRRFDVHVERQEQAALVKERIATRKRHRQQFLAASLVLQADVRAAATALAKGDRYATCSLWTHDLGWECRLLTGGELIATQVCRSEAEIG
jgi:hypothetical protein